MHKTVDDVAYIEIPDSTFIHKLESKWCYLESRMATAFQALDNGTLLRSKKDIDTVKKFISLHYVRSITVLLWTQKNSEKYFNKAIEDSIKVNPSRAEEIFRNKEEYKIKWKEELATKTIPEMLQKSYPKVEEYVQNNDLIIAQATQGTDFCLADIPVINMDEKGQLGVLSGVDITHSIAFTMPLGPRHVAALISKSDSIDYGGLNNRQVKNFNDKSLKIARYHYYTCPKSYEAIY